MKWNGLFCAVLALFSGVSQGAVSLAGTRLVFDGRFTEAAIEVSNRSDADALIQAWLEDPRPGASAPIDLPFVVTPPLARLPAQGRQTLRLLYQGAGMPGDRESLLHLFVLEVPRRSEAAQQLNIAIRQRINVFYRPKGLSGDPADAAQQLAWQRSTRDGAVLSVRNPTPFHVALQNLSIDDAEVSDYQLMPPFSSLSLTLPARFANGAAQGRLSFKALTDYGGQRDYCAEFQGLKPFTVPLRAADSHSLIGKC